MKRIHVRIHRPDPFLEPKSRFQFGGDAPEDTKITISLKELNALIDKADIALDGDSSDAEHDALYSIREELAEWSTDPEARKCSANR